MSSVSVSRVSFTPSPEDGLEAWFDYDGNLVIPAAALPDDAAGTVRVAFDHGRARSGGSCAAAPVWRPREGGSCAAAPVWRRTALAVLGALLIGAIVVFAANGHDWRWTGFAGGTTLWSWLRMLAQPTALAFLVFRLLSDRPAQAWRVVGWSGGVLLGLLIFAGYTQHWRWTGFADKQLWDWLNLMLFPVVAVLLPEWAKRGESIGPRARVAAALLAAAFTVLVVGGYRWGWTWTGFTGNTFRDWLVLMIAPFLLPVSLRLAHVFHSSRRASGGSVVRHHVFVSPAR